MLPPNMYSFIIQMSKNEFVCGITVSKAGLRCQGEKDFMARLFAGKKHEGGSGVPSTPSPPFVRRVENPGYQVSDTAKPPLALPPNRVALHRNPGDAGEVGERPSMGFGT